MIISRRTSTDLDGDRRLGLRLALASIAVALMMVPFTLLLVVAKMPLNDLDSGVARALHAYARANPDVTEVMILWTDVFGPWPWRVAVAVLAGWLVHRGAPRLALWAITTITVGGLLGLGLKILVDRSRPHLPDPVALAPGDAFPSGHALTVTLGAGVIVLALLPALPQWGRKLAWTVAGFLIVTVSFTRVALAVHWVSDVLGGIVLGAAVIIATTAAFETWRRDEGRRPAAPPRDGVEPESVQVTRD
ncbi:phosphatase PAP2 family protein [Nonomuraea indica]|uniref:phosphatase PAP2 family protein n=1 Tax=Nonomuraea indica TaxID=1581193 RepID=UPI000C7A8DBA|nr:phosphatase PAP2 family protein [Nonomuraea indica]